MIVAAQNGCCLSELCDLRLDRVGLGRCEIVKSNTDAGIHEIPKEEPPAGPPGGMDGMGGMGGMGGMM